MTTATFSVENLTVTFGGNAALSDVSLGVRSGEIHAIAGANGSGKSTLIKVLTGVYKPDSGAVVVKDTRMEGGWDSPAATRQHGLGVVHQEAPLIDSLSIAQCVALLQGYRTTRYGRLKLREQRRYTQALLDRYAIPLHADDVCGDLTPAQRALVSLAVALSAGGELLILDEATASLTDEEAAAVLEVVRGLTTQGVAVLMITHRLKEIHEIADRVSVLSAGRVVHSGPARELDEEELIALMVPGDRAHAEQQAALATSETETAPTVLSVEAIAGPGLPRCSFELRGGEVLGITGLPDSGIQTLPMALFGASRLDSGTISVDGRTLTGRLSPSRARGAGIALLPRDRLTMSGIMGRTVRDNIAMAAPRKYWHRRAQRERDVRQVIETLDVRPQDPDALLSSLSGGNQQKVLLGKWLLLEPRVLVLDDPTNGVDPAARRILFEAVRRQAGAGSGVVVFSSEAEQLAINCDRVLVLQRSGDPVELTGSDLNATTIARWAAR